MSTQIQLPLNFRGPVPTDRFLWDYLGQAESLELLGDRIMENENDVHRAKSFSISRAENPDVLTLDRIADDAAQTVDSIFQGCRKPNLIILQGYTIRSQLAQVMRAHFQVDENQIDAVLDTIFKHPQAALQFYNSDLANLLCSSATYYHRAQADNQFSEVTIPLNGAGSSCLIYLGRVGGYTIESLVNVLRHEMAHAYQYASGYCSPVQLLGAPESIIGFMEGHAVGVEGILSRRASDKGGYIRGDYLRETQGFLCAAYAMVCEKYNLAPQSHVVSVVGGILDQPLAYYTQFPQVVGAAAFAVAEERYGEEIYRRALFGDGLFWDD